jgi:hypothetical protein
VHRRLCKELAVYIWERKGLDHSGKRDCPCEFVEDVFTAISVKLERGVKVWAVAEFLE